MWNCSEPGNSGERDASPPPLPSLCPEVRRKRRYNKVMGNSFSRSWALARESYNVLRSNPQLALFPIISGIASIIVTISFAVPMWLTQDFNHGFNRLTPLHYTVIFCFYLASYFVVIFFNAGLVSCAHDSLQGRPTSFSAGMSNAVRHLPSIIMWTLIAATVGTILRAISERVGIVGQIIVAILGAAWTIITYFVVPILVIANVGPFAAIKESAALFKRTWGERVIASVGLGMAMFVLILLGFVPMVVGIVAAVNGLWPVAITGFALMVIYFLALSIIFSALAGIFNTALYVYASTGEVPRGFSEQSIRGAFRPKQNKKVFGIG